MRISTVLTIALAWNAAFVSAAGTAVQPTIVLRVVNEGRVDPEMLRAAQKEAARILRSSGIELVWMVCEPEHVVQGDRCGRVMAANEFWMRVVTRRPSNTNTDVLGFTELGGEGRADSAAVFAPAAAALAGNWGLTSGQILGAAMVHEIGHLYLGVHAHVAASIMSGHWTRQELMGISIGELTFSRPQARMLQERIAGNRGMPPQK